MNKKDKMKRMNLEELIKVMNLIIVLEDQLEELNAESSIRREVARFNEMQLALAEIRYELVQAILSIPEWKEADLKLRR
jgi:hypothetical protein